MLPIFEFVAKMAEVDRGVPVLPGYPLDDAERLWRSSNPSFPRLARLRRVGNKHQLSGIEKVKRIAVVSMKPLSPVFSRVSFANC